MSLNKLNIWDMSVLLPIDYKRLTDRIMTLPLPFSIVSSLELFGHPVGEKQKTEFNEKRGIFITVRGWKMFWDKVGTYQPHYLYNRGHIYDAENGLGYIGDMISDSDGKPYPNIEWWAIRTRLEYPGKGLHKIDKTNSIYDYESKDM